MLHTVGDKNCKECCCGKRWEHEGCGGLWHTCLVDDTPEEGYIHNDRCDRCGLKRYNDKDIEYEIKFDVPLGGRICEESY